MITKEKLMAVAFACAMMPSVYAADVNGADGNPATDLTIEAPQTTVTGDATVTGTVTVQQASTTPTPITNNNNINQMNAVAGSDNGTSTAFQTVLGGAQADYVDATGGGAVINGNGNVTLNAASGTNNSVIVSRQTSVRLFNADQGGLSGTPVPDTQSYFLVDSSGTEIAGTRISVDPANPALDTAAEALAAFSAAVDGTSANPADNFDYQSAAFNSARTSTPLPNAGGNLSVGGTANVTGVLALGDTGGGAVIDAATAINTNATGVTTNANAIAAEATTARAAEQANADAIAAEATTARAAEQANANAITAEATTARAAEQANADAITAEATTARAAEQANADAITAEATTARAAEQALGIRVDDETARAMAAEQVNADAITTEATTARAAEQANADAITAEAATARAAEQANSNAIAAEAATARAAEQANSNAIATETTNRIAADSALQSQINNNASAIANNASNIDRNKRGIAMVAAMTNTTVLPGKTQAVDFNLAHFEGETGFSFGYAHKINADVQLRAAVASTTDFEESIVRVGVSYQW